MSDLRIVGVSVSLEVKRSAYDKPSVENRFVSLQAHVPEGHPGESDSDALLRTLELHQLAFESVYSADLAAGIISKEDYNLRTEKLRQRMLKIKSFFNPKETQ